MIMNMDGLDVQDVIPFDGGTFMNANFGSPVPFILSILFIHVQISFRFGEFRFWFNTCDYVSFVNAWSI